MWNDILFSSKLTLNFTVILLVVDFYILSLKLVYIENFTIFFTIVMLPYWFQHALFTKIESGTKKIAHFPIKYLAVEDVLLVSFYLSAFFVCLLYSFFCENSAPASVGNSDMLCRFYGHDVVKTFETLSPCRIFQGEHGLTNTPKISDALSLIVSVKKFFARQNL